LPSSFILLASKSGKFGEVFGWIRDPGIDNTDVDNGDTDGTSVDPFFIGPQLLQSGYKKTGPKCQVR